MDTETDVPTYERADAPTADRIDDLLERMTVAEKAGRTPTTWSTS